MKKKIYLFLFLMLTFIFPVAGCSQKEENEDTKNKNSQQENSKTSQENADKNDNYLTLTSEITKLTDGLSAVKYEGDYGFDEFLTQGGASSDTEVVSYLTENIMPNTTHFSFGKIPFGCSTISVTDENGSSLFGRNFDWNTCNAMIVQSIPENGYASISTVNTDFIKMSGLRLSDLPADIQAVICLYAPLDGMNEKGLAVSVNMIQDNDTISQNTDKPDITTTTAIRLLLDKAATTQEAVELLLQYDMHASMGYMMHLAISDRQKNSIVIEYVNNEMIVVETCAVTNFYLAEGEKNGIGTQQSHERYNILMNILAENKTMNMDKVKDALNSVSKKNFGEFESTEWSVVFNQSTGEVRYYHRENYNKSYCFSLKQ